MFASLLDYTRGAGGPKDLVSNHLKSAWIGDNEEDAGKLQRMVGMDDARFSLFDTDYEIKPSEVVIFSDKCLISADRFLLFSTKCFCQQAQTKKVFITKKLNQLDASFRP